MALTRMGSADDSVPCSAEGIADRDEDRLNRRCPSPPSAHDRAGRGGWRCITPSQCARASVGQAGLASDPPATISSGALTRSHQSAHRPRGIRPGLASRVCGGA
jgi:hypothetical protein